ncbi:MAG TPA: alpha/beta hydrolase [Flavobacteriales bacterium]|nr:alpha/beta hydrolase [Flavobacteriales bacterium]
MELNYKEFGQGRALIILHGLLGSLDNWQTLARRFGEDFHVFTLDQRNHGQSPHSAEMTYSALAEDLHDFIEKHHLHNPILLGHSMGGKTVMTFALKYPEKVQKLIVADISPKDYGISHREILEALSSVNFNVLKDRKSIQDHLMQRINNLGIVLFLTKNIFWEDKDKLAFRFNLPVLSDSIAHLSGWEPNQGRYSGSTLFIRGGNSPYVDDADPAAKSQFPNSEIETIPGAGHWLHAEKPEEFYHMVRSYILG